VARISGADHYKLELSTEGKPERAPYASIKETVVDLAIGWTRFLESSHAKLFSYERHARHLACQGPQACPRVALCTVLHAASQEQAARQRVNTHRGSGYDYTPDTCLCATSKPERPHAPPIQNRGGHGRLLPRAALKAIAEGYQQGLNGRINGSLLLQIFGA
jgi:hypothetical protein